MVIDGRVGRAIRASFDGMASQMTDSDGYPA
jgi:hypothetical protein